MYFAGTLGISKRDFYTKIGVSRGTLESKTGITEDVLTKFFATYPEVSVEWIMLGFGEMLKTKRTSKVKTDNTQDNLEDKITNLIGDKQPLKPVIDSFMGYLQEKDKEIGTLNKEIGKLEARIEQLEKERRDNQVFPTTNIPKVETPSPPVLQDI